MLRWITVLLTRLPVTGGESRPKAASGAVLSAVRDTLVRTGLYARVRHPIYGGGVAIFGGLALLRPTAPVLVASALGIGWALVQARLEELDLVQRLPDYREYMRQVPRLFPRLG